VRAERRYLQLKEQGSDASYESVLSELNQRDRQDTQRLNDPLRQAVDALLLDTSKLNFKESVDAIVAIANEAYGKAR
jgi:cytidylate kinase